MSKRNDYEYTLQRMADQSKKMDTKLDSKLIQKYNVDYRCGDIKETEDFKVIGKTSNQEKMDDLIDNVKKENEQQENQKGLVEIKKQWFSNYLNVGDELKQIGTLKHLKIIENEEYISNEDLVSFEHKGEVILLDVWATWCGPCQRPMQHNQDMLLKNKDSWKNNVRIVGINVDDGDEEVIQKVKAKKWYDIEHYRIQKGWDADHEMMQKFKINGIPFVILLDKDGKINYIGHPSSIKLEERINSLLNSSQNTDQEIDYSQITQLDNLISNFKTVLENTQIKAKISLEYDLKTIIDSKNIYHLKQPVYNVTVYQKDEDELNKLNQLIFQNYDFKSIKYELNVIDNKKLNEKIFQIFKENNQESNLKKLDKKSQITFAQKSQQLKFEQKQNFMFDGNFKTNSLIDLDTQYKKLKETLENELNNQIKDQNLNNFLNKSILGLEFDQFNEFLGKYLENAQFEEKEYNIIEKKEGQEKMLIMMFYMGYPYCLEIGIQLNEWAVNNKDTAVYLIEVSQKNEESKNYHKKNHSNITVLNFIQTEVQDKVHQLGLQDFPFFIYFDQSNTVQSILEPENESITEIIEQLTKVNVQNNNNEQQIQDDKYKSISKELKKMFRDKEFRNQFKKISYDFDLILQFNKTIEFDQNGKYLAINKKPSISSWLRSEDNKLIESIRNKVGQDIEIINELVNFVYGEKCWKCNNELKKDKGQYFCYFNNEYYCVDCGDKFEINEEKVKVYQIPHNLVWIDTENESYLNNIDVYKLGKNIQPNSKGDQQHNFGCNGTCDSSDLEGQRFICLNTRPGKMVKGGHVDMCEKCMNILRDKSEGNQEKRNDLINHLNKTEKYQEGYLFFRILFNTEYFKY